MNKSNGILLSCLVLVGMLLTTIHATAVATGTNIPISGAVFNPCNGETVTFSGLDHNVFALTLDANGGFHLILKDNIHVTATGSLGNSYEGNQEDVNQFNGRVGLEQTFALTFSEISTGAAPNFDVNALMHVTVNPNGTVTVFFSNFTSVCRG